MCVCRGKRVFAGESGEWGREWGEQTLELLDRIHIKQQPLFALFVSAAVAFCGGHAPRLCTRAMQRPRDFGHSTKCLSAKSNIYIKYGSQKQFTFPRDCDCHFLRVEALHLSFSATLGCCRGSPFLLLTPLLLLLILYTAAAATISQMIQAF